MTNRHDYNTIINETVKALEAARYERADGTPIAGWGRCEGAEAVDFAQPALTAMMDGLQAMVIAAAHQGPGLTDREIKFFRDGLEECISETLYDTINFNADVDPADTLADWKYDCRDQEGLD